MAFVLSSHAHAKILSIDASKALVIPGVIEFFSSQHNFPLNNKFGMSIQDDEIFADGEVSFYS
jgi:xanthine dehydrogenase/oxidase